MFPILTEQWTKELKRSTYQGYHCVYHHVGIKVFRTPSAVKFSYEKQLEAFKLDAAPPVLSEIFCVPDIGHGYVTGHAEPSLDLFPTTQENWKDNLVNPEFVELCRKIHEVMPRYQDLHSSNIGVWDGHLVCIDFYSGCHWI